MKQHELSKLHEAALTRTDGIYSKFGIPYAVKDNKLVALWEKGEFFTLQMGWLIHSGHCETRWNAQKELKRLLKG